MVTGDSEYGHGSLKSYSGKRKEFQNVAKKVYANATFLRNENWCILQIIVGVCEEIELKKKKLLNIFKDDDAFQHCIELRILFKAWKKNIQMTSFYSLSWAEFNILHKQNEKKVIVEWMDE